MNDIAYSYFVAKAPWGGTKGSGYGRTHGLDGLRELSRTKYVDVDSGRLPVPWWYPYRSEALDGLKGALELLYRRNVASRGRGAVKRREGIAHLAKRYVGR
jgi:succinate-semialdehyde dehydrogenase/glutarate-semialdehyde dehydrogenase